VANAWDPDGDQTELKSWEKLMLGIRSVAMNEDDPDNTMQIGVTQRELALITFGGYLVLKLFPELGGTCMRLQEKLIELSEAQEFLPRS